MTSPAQLAPCPRCGSTGAHGYVHTRHGNGGGDNRPCPNTPPAYTTDHEESRG